MLMLLFATFFKIGLFSFGGGYAMIPLIQHELEMHGWLTPAEFVDIIGIAEMTPGPIAVNAATFVGYRTAGFIGGLAATFGVALPSLLLILFLAEFFFRYRSHPLHKTVFHCIRPAVTGLIAAAAIAVAETSLFRMSFQAGFLSAISTHPTEVVDLVSLLLFGIFLFLLLKFKLHPVLLMGIAALTGIFVYWFIPVLFPPLI